MGVVADDPGKEMEFKVFHAKILREVYMQVKADIKMIVQKEMGRMQRDPDLMLFRVERS